MGTGDHQLWAAYERRRYTTLFYALLFTLVAMPAATTAGLSPALIKFFVGACLLAAVMPNATRRSRWFLFASFLVLIGARVAEDGILHIRPGTAIALFGAVGLAAAAGSLRFAVTAKRVNSEVIYATISTYLLAGVFFGQLYWSLERLVPGSIAGPEELTEWSAVDYSFVTLTTLGYGDVLPKSDLARGMAMLEVVGGQLFLAVMVARLIGAFDAERQG